MLRHLLGIGEGNSIDALKGVVGVVAKEVARRGLHDFHCLDPAGVGDVRTQAEVDERATSINCGRSTIGNLRVEEVLLVFVVIEHLDQIFLLDD